MLSGSGEGGVSKSGYYAFLDKWFGSSIYAVSSNGESYVLAEKDRRCNNADEFLCLRSMSANDRLYGRLASEALKDGRVQFQPVARGKVLALMNRELGVWERLGDDDSDFVGVGFLQSGGVQGRGGAVGRAGILGAAILVGYILVRSIFEKDEPRPLDLGIASELPLPTPIHDGEPKIIGVPDQEAFLERQRKLQELMSQILWLRWLMEIRPDDYSLQLELQKLEGEIVALRSNISGELATVASAGDGTKGGIGPTAGTNEVDMELKIERQPITMNLRYHDGLVEFKNRCTDYPSIKAFLDSIFDQDVLGIRSSTAKTGNSRFLDVGCGDGTITSHLADILVGTSKGHARLDVVEPMQSYIAQTDGTVGSARSRGLQVAFIQARAEDFFGNDDLAQSYDLVFASHSLHLIPLDKMGQIASVVRPGGYFVVVIGAKKSIMSILKDLFISKPAITGEDVLRTMSSGDLGREFTVQPISQPSFLDMRDIELPEMKVNLTETAKNLLSLMIQKNIDDITQEDYLRVRQLILDRLENGFLRLENDCFVFKKSVGN